MLVLCEDAGVRQGPPDDVRSQLCFVRSFVVSRGEHIASFIARSTRRCDSGCSRTNGRDLCSEGQCHMLWQIYSVY